MSDWNTQIQFDQSVWAGPHIAYYPDPITGVYDLLAAVGIDQPLGATFAGIVATLFPKSPNLAKVVRFLVPCLIWLARFCPGYRAAIKGWLLSSMMSCAKIEAHQHRLLTAFKNWASVQSAKPIALSYSQSIKLWIAKKFLVTEPGTLVARVGDDQNTWAEPSGEPPGQLTFQPESSSWSVFVGPDGRIHAYRTDAKNHSVEIWTFGWSNEPIAKLLREVHDWDKSQDKVQVYSCEDGCSWALQSTNPPRTLDSIYLKASLKKALFDDLEQFLEPTRKSWYEDKGIPYRRGYMFFGKPGCGKTSLARAIAGYFQLNVYCLSLVHPEVTDESLIQLFQNVGHRAMILFEDIDSAGIGRESIQAAQKNKDAAAEDQQDDPSDTESNRDEYDFDSQHSQYSEGVYETSDEGYGISRHANPPSRGRGAFRGFSRSRGGKIRSQASRTRQGKKDHDELPKSNVTLRGLLNALDGISSSTGYIIVMTTNHPENVDSAIKRPGRIDFNVELGKAGKKQAYQMFHNMFQPVEDFIPPYDVSQIPSQARAFAEQVPRGEVTPAELQGYLMRYLTQPQKAVDGAADWVKRISKAAKDDQETETFHYDEDDDDLDSFLSSEGPHGHL